MGFLLFNRTYTRLGRYRLWPTNFSVHYCSVTESLLSTRLDDFGTGKYQCLRSPLLSISLSHGQNTGIDQPTSEITNPFYRQEKTVPRKTLHSTSDKDSMSMNTVPPRYVSRCEFWCLPKRGYLMLRHLVLRYFVSNMTVDSPVRPTVVIHTTDRGSARITRDREP